MSLRKQAELYTRICQRILMLYPFHVAVPVINEKFRPDKYATGSGNHFGRIPRTPGVALTATWCFETQEDADEFKTRQGL